MATQIDLEQAVALAKKVLVGDSSAESGLLKFCEPVVRKCLSRLANQVADIDDLTQESMIVLLLHLREGRLRKPEKLHSFAASIARNQFYMECRKRGRWNPSVAREVYGQGPIPGCPVENQVETIQAINFVWQKMKVCRDKSVLIDLIGSGNTKKDLIAKYQVKPAHFDRVVYRARERFKLAWIQQYDGRPDY